MNNINFIEGIIDRIEKDKAVIKLNDGQTIIWDKKKLPEEIKEGSSVKITINCDSEGGEEKEKFAKDLLNELLKPKKEN